MFEQGALGSEVVRRLGTSRQNTSCWHARWRHGGRAALRAAGRAGRRPQLSPAQRRQVERALLKGARVQGFDTNLWTLGRIAVVIERLTGGAPSPRPWLVGAAAVELERAAAGSSRHRTR